MKLPNFGMMTNVDISIMPFDILGSSIPQHELIYLQKNFKK